MAVIGILKSFYQKFKKNENHEVDIYRIVTSEKQTLSVFIHLWEEWTGNICMFA